MRGIVLVVPLCGACVHNAARFLAPEEFVTPAPEERSLAEVRYASGWAEESSRPYDPEPFGPVDGVTYERPVWVTDRGWIEVAPLQPGTELRLYLRKTGTSDSAFFPVVTVTGAIPGRIPQEVRFVGGAVEEPERIVLSDLTNVYEGYRLEDGDLLLVEVSADGAPTERWFFRSRRFGFRTKTTAGVLVRLPFPLVETDKTAPTSPVLAASFAVGYRPRTRRAGLKKGADRLALVGSVGIGSTALRDASVEDPVADQVVGFFDAALAGGGVELFDFLSLQALANVSALSRDNDEAGWTLAVGVDAVQLGRFTRDAGARLLRKNQLSQESDTDQVPRPSR